MLAFLDGKHVVYAAPTKEQVDKFWHEICVSLAEPIEFGVYRKLESEKKIELVGTQQCIRCRTAWNPDTLRGGFADLLILDEFQLMQEDTWDQVGAPMLADHNGDAVFIYTPPSMRMRAKSKARDPLHAAKMFKAHVNDERWLCVHFRSQDNPFISPEGLQEVSNDLTQLAYRQEILAEDIDQVPGALWTQTLIDETRVTEIPAAALPFLRIVVGVDPTGSSTNEAGIAACAKGSDGHGYLIEDASCLGPTSEVWGRAAIDAFHRHRADRLLGERNYGGDMVAALIRLLDPSASYKDVNATRGKLVRAEPIAALYEKRLIHHVGVHARLEEEMCSYVPGNTSPNRMDAMVWGFTELFPLGANYGLSAALNEAEAEHVEKVKQIINLAKPHTNGDTPGCPKCHNKVLIRIQNRKRCNTCGWEETPLAVPNPAQSRADLLAK